MLGLRKNPLSEVYYLTTRRSRSSITSSPAPEASSEDLTADPAMDVLRPGRQDSRPATPVKIPASVGIAVKEVHQSDSEESTSQQTEALTVTSKKQTITSDVQITRVIETTRTIKRKIICELDDVDDIFFERITLDSYLEFIANERLIHMPRRGSQWDRVLKAAEFFGLQIYTFGQAVSHFVPDSKSASFVALAGCRLLLELGHNQAQALEPTFNALYEFGLLVSQTLRKHELFDANERIKEDLGEVYAGLVELVGSIAVYYRQRINSMTTSSVTIDFDGAFGKTINSIWAKKEHLTNHMWSFKVGHKHYSISIESLRQKLSPADRSVKAILYGRVADKSERAEGTCEWVQGHLLEFLRSSDSIFTITGASGCGKSMLAGWMKERLQRPLGRKSYETISYTFASDAPAEAAPVAFLKSLLFQLLERNVGDARLYEKLVKAFETHSEHKDAEKLQVALWEALEAGLKTVNDANVNLIIVVDGFDEIVGKESHSASHLHQRLHKCVDKFSRTRAITLSKPISHLGSAGCKHLVITPDHTHDDITAYLRQSMAKHQHYISQGRATQEDFIKKLVHKAKGSFLWAYLVVNSQAMETSYENYFNAGEAMHSDVHGLIQKLVGKVDLKNATTKHMLAFMLVAERPLTVGEMAGLLSVNLHKRTLTPEVTDLSKHIAATCSVIVVERNGLIRFKHSAIRRFMLELCGKSLMALKEAHCELTKRMLFYAKCSLSVSYEPSFDGLSTTVIEDTFRSHCLMKYVVRNWVGHFRSSTLCDAKGELILSSEFKEIFPQSTLFVMMEWSCWQSQTSAIEAMELHNLTLRIRTACFGEKHRSVMQTLIIMGNFYRTRSELTKASEFFYRASCIGQAVLYKFSTVVVVCTNAFLTCTETLTITKRTEIVTYREEMIRFMIEICKCKHGASSDHVIRWYEVLAKLYIDIKEEYRATVIYKELYEIIVMRFGKGSDRARGISETLGGMTVVLNGDKSGDEVVQYDEWIFETSEEIEVTDELRISIILRLCKTYEAHGKWFLAEKLYINLWRRISEICRIKASVELHLVKINIALEYVRFLQRIKRIEEASNILICLWAEYEHHSFESETIIIRIKEIGILFRAFGLLSVAVSVFANVWGWFKSRSKTTHEEAVSTTVLITEVIEEITEQTTTTKTTTTTTTVVTETVVKEIFETTYTHCKQSKVDIHLFKACMALINLYIKQERWSECEVIIKRSLELTWKEVLTVDVKIALSGSFVNECILVATRLAICYHRQRCFEKAEQIYLRIYRACMVSFGIEDIHVTEASLALIRFYEEYHRHDKAIEIYIELLHGYRKHLGASHKLTIKTLYALGSLCIMLGRKEAYEYYIEIVTTLNKGGHCHHDAFEAAVIVCKYYYEEKRWVELQKICAVLWETFIHHHHEYTFTEEMIQVIYERYVYVLEFHAKVEFSVLYKLSVEYRETVTKCFGVSAAIVITAMIALATICEKHEKHYHESITIYEEVIKKIKTTTTMTTTVTETIIKTVKKRLSKVYVTVITTGSSTTTMTIERGIAVCLEIYEQLKVEFSWWHEKTLTQLRELVLLYKKLGSHESHTTIIRLLQVSVIEIITKVTTSITLYQAATTLASIYVACEMTKVGHELLHQLRHLIVLHDIESTDITIKLGCKVSKVSFVFLLAFEQGLAEKTVCSYSEVMADILLETFLYEQYTQVIKTETKIEIVLECSAKLRAFWEIRGRGHQVSILDKKLFQMFKAKYGSFVKTHDSTIFAFYVSLLAELGKERSKVDFSAIVCLVSNTKVKALLEAGDFQQAHEVAKCSFQLISSQRFYHHMPNLHYGYKLAEFMAGIDVRKPADNKLRESMLGTSKHIVDDVLAACREAKINLVSLKFEDLAGLVRLLGEQHNYGELEFLLEQLWQSREVQKTWSSTTVLSIGRSLVHARYANKHISTAIELCDTICYNLRRSRGWLDDDALAMSELLAKLYTSQHRHREAMGLHEEILREIDENDDMEKAYYANHHLELLKRAYQRNGAWDKSEKSYQELYATLKRFGLSVQPIEQWSSKGADAMGTYVIPQQWKLEVDEMGMAKGRKRPNWVRVSSGRWYGSSSYGETKPGCGHAWLQQNKPSEELTR